MPIDREKVSIIIEEMMQDEILGKDLIETLLKIKKLLHNMEDILVSQISKMQKISNQIPFATHDNTLKSNIYLNITLEMACIGYMNKYINEFGKIFKDIATLEDCRFIGEEVENKLNHDFQKYNKYR